MKDAIKNTGPIITTVASTSDVFIHYSSGIMDSDDCGEKGSLGIDATLVGYGTEDG